MESKMGLFIAERRKELGITQQQLADKLYVTDKAVSKWERGKALPDIKSLKPLAEILEVSVVELLDGQLHGRNEERQPDGSVGKHPQYADDIIRESLLYYVNDSKKRSFRIIAAIILIIVILIAQSFISDRITKKEYFENTCNTMERIVEELGERDIKMSFDDMGEYRYQYEYLKLYYDSLTPTVYYVGDSASNYNFENTKMYEYHKRLKEDFLEMYNAMIANAKIENGRIYIDEEGQNIINKSLNDIEIYYPKFKAEADKLN